MSLALAGPFRMAVRLGRNARYSAVGNGVGAALMGACGQYLSERGVFYLTAALTLPALVTLLPLRRFSMARIASQSTAAVEPKARVLKVLADRRLLVFCACAMLFTFANAPLLMLISGTLAAHGSNPSLLIGACIVLPQIIVALASPAVGRFADRYGRRLVLIIGFLMLPMRALVFSTTSNSVLVIAAQVLDGIAGAGFGILVPLVVSDVAARSGHFNLSLGAVGFAIGIGATVSTSAAGWVADHFGMRHAFYFLASVGLAAVLLALFAMPETRPEPEEDAGASGTATSAGRAASTAPPPPRLPRGA
jgi:MFS family permease